MEHVRKAVIVINAYNSNNASDWALKLQPEILYIVNHD